ncbi:hypothetical protein [Haladaptatus salinisoli]|uniref:hypothetical protein n=1 Tax=Haladaptatus salinisoli TaxID=2884876 RepID=UPI001D0BBA42|nr:hypothetical protein [Haladaptatus salinisoli]
MHSQRSAFDTRETPLAAEHARVTLMRSRPEDGSVVCASTAFPTKGRSGRALLFTAYLLLTLGIAVAVTVPFDVAGDAFVVALVDVAALLFVPFRWLYGAVAGIARE